jgi:hypothetical protein
MCACAQENYGGIGIGYSEACRTKYAPGFAGGDCITPNADIHSMLGKQINDYFALEGSFDVSFDGGDLINGVLNLFASDATDQEFYYQSETRTGRWMITTLAVHAFAELPVTNNIRLFAGPSLGGSIVNFDYDVPYFGNDSYDQKSATEFGMNYGWAAGVDLISADDHFVRFQWQNWRSLDANVAVNGKFNSNTFTITMGGYF